MNYLGLLIHANQIHCQQHNYQIQHKQEVSHLDSYHRHFRRKEKEQIYPCHRKDLMQHDWLDIEPY